MMLLNIDETIAKEKEEAKRLRKIIETGYDGEISIEAMFCDDTDAIKEAAYERFKNCAKEHEQRAEWLEELKEYRKHIELTEIPEQYKFGFQDGIVNGFENGYNKAIDDFASELENHSIYADIGKLDEVKMEWVSPVTRIKEVAERLKAGGAE